MAKVYRMSAEKYKELKAEFSYLSNEGREEVNQRLKEARAFGDLSENAEYDAARDEQAKLQARIDELKVQIENSEIIKEESVPEGVVGMGSTVKISYDEAETDTETFRIVGSVESDPMNGLMSEESVIGKAVMGRKQGEWVTYNAPIGPMKCKIVSVTKD